jgi:hypothetical protein
MAVRTILLTLLVGWGGWYLLVHATHHLAQWMAWIQL